MIWIILGVIVAAYLTYLSFREEFKTLPVEDQKYKDDDNYTLHYESSESRWHRKHNARPFREKFWPALGWSLFGTLIIGVFVGLIIMLTVAVSLAFADKKTARWDIATIADNQGLHGSFSLFGGSINDTPVFYYYREDGAARYLDHVDAGDATVYEDSESPYFTCKYPVVDHRWLSYPFGELRDYCGDYVFHIPPGSISTKIILDAQ